MIFLQPFILWGLPLVLLPVIIHLINRLRHRPQPWAAMRFLISASRSSVGHAKLRQFLVLLFRVLAVLMLVLFLSRPLAGGWLGWVLSPAPDVIVVLLDRSASMETRIPGSPLTRREQALQLITQSAQEFQETSHLVLIESVFREPQEISNIAALSQLPITAPSEGTADIPAMLQTAVDWLIKNRAGVAELWICSDLQRTDWRAGSSLWESVQTQLAALPQQIRVRLLSFPPTAEPNASVQLEEVQRFTQNELRFLVNLQASAVRSEPIPVTATLNNVSSQKDLALDGQFLRWRHKMDVGAAPDRGWGGFQLPADANANDNAAYFIYRPPAKLKALVVSQDPVSSRFLALASAAFQDSETQPAAIAAGPAFRDEQLANVSLLIWQDPLPQGPIVSQIHDFVEEGGIALFLPPGKADSNRFLDFGWGEIQNSPADAVFPINRWNREDGPLANTEENLPLPLPDAGVIRRQQISGGLNVLAAFADGSPFLIRQNLGRGEIFFCSTLPRPDWSSLSDGPVLVPLLQRLLQSGGERLQPVSSVVCGDLGAFDQSLTWTAVDSAAPKDPRVQTGVFKAGDRWLAVNRPPAEDEPETLELAQARALFKDLPFQSFQEQTNDSSRLQGEIWRTLLICMLLFLLVEGILILPEKTQSGQTAPAPASNVNPGRKAVQTA